MLRTCPKRNRLFPLSVRNSFQMEAGTVGNLAPRGVGVFGGDRSAIYCVTGNLVRCEAGWVAVPVSWIWPAVVLSQSSRHARCASQIPRGKEGS